MRNVYIINLKDNRGKGEKVNCPDKFNVCLTDNIIALGWTTEDSRKDNLAFDKAYKTMKDMIKSDLVWTRNPHTKEYYICEITDTVNHGESLKEKSGLEYENFDISCYREVEFIKIGAKEDLPEDITYRNLISRSTARRVNNKTVIDATNEKFNTIYENKKTTGS